MRQAAAALLSVMLASCTTEFDPALLDGSNCGCRDSVGCLPGNTVTACGKNGVACAQCVSPLSVCESGACVVPNAVGTLSLADVHTGAVDRLGGLWLWGSNSAGALAQPITVLAVSKPTKVTAPELEWTSIAVGNTSPELHSCAIGQPGQLYCWGANGDGQTGLGSVNPGSVPTEVGTEADWLAVGAGKAFTCGIRAPGTLWCWGFGGAALRLGFAASNLPSDTRTPQQVPGSESWAKLSVGFNHSCAIQKDQSLWCWGSNESGQLGHAGESAPPAQVTDGTSFARVSAGGQHTCGIRSNGSLWCWGDNSRGQLGFSGSAAAPQRVDERSDWVSIAAGGAHTCGARADGALLCWGAGDSGQLGTGGFDDAPVPTQISESTDWSSVAAGLAYSCGVKLDGTLWCWGNNSSAQIGASSDPTVPTPVSVLLE